MTEEISNIDKKLNYKKFSNISPLEEWETLALKCEYRIPDQYGSFNCAYYEGSVGICDYHYCPLISEDKRIELERLEELYNCVTHLKVMV